MNTNRILSIDIFRGLTITFMLLVNNPGSWKYVYPHLAHADWHGATPTDMVFPFFLFIVGASMFFSFKKYNHRITQESAQKIIWRTIKIFLAGMLLNLYPLYSPSLFTAIADGHFKWGYLIDNEWMKFSSWRYFGVLQRIALAYGIASFIILGLNKKQMVWIGTGILLLYWGLLMLYGGNEPLGKDNMAGALDQFLWGEKHIYQGFGLPFDPEGLLNTMAAIVTPMFGFYTGYLLSLSIPRMTVIWKLLRIGTVLLGISLLWDNFFPINKPLWTSSYVLFTAGLSMWVLAAITFIWDVSTHRNRLLPVGLLSLVGFTAMAYLSNINTPLWTLAGVAVFISILMLIVGLLHTLNNGKKVNSIYFPFNVFGHNALFMFIVSGVIANTAIDMLKFKDTSGKITHAQAWTWDHLFSALTPNMHLNSLCSAITFMLFLYLIAYMLYRKHIIIKL